VYIVGFCHAIANEDEVGCRNVRFIGFCGSVGPNITKRLMFGVMNTAYSSRLRTQSMNQNESWQSTKQKWTIPLASTILYE